VRLVQSLNLPEELAAFRVIVGELVETFAKGVQLEADTLTENPVVVEVVLQGNTSQVRVAHNRGVKARFNRHGQVVMKRNGEGINAKTMAISPPR
jgi:hypothetical protein